MLKREPNVVEASIYLKKRYAEITIAYPDFARKVTESQYVAVNLPYALRNQRADYGHWADATFQRESTAAPAAHPRVLVVEQWNGREWVTRKLTWDAERGQYVE